MYRRGKKKIACIFVIPFVLALLGIFVFYLSGQKVTDVMTTAQNGSNATDVNATLPIVNVSNRGKRDVTSQGLKRRPIAGVDKVIIQVPRNTTVAAEFDLCDVIPCKGFYARYRKAEVYICIFPHGKPASELRCPDWSFVYWNSNPRGYVNPSNQYIPSGLRDKISLVRAKRTKETYKRGRNPLVLTVKNMWVNPWSAADHRDLDHFHLILGANVLGKDPRGVLKIQFVDPAPTLDPVADATVGSFLPSKDTPDPLVTSLNLSSSDVNDGGGNRFYKEKHLP